MAIDVPTLVMAATGETFEMLESSRSQPGMFRFRWTLAPGKSGPPEHTHPTETESFELQSGSLRVWIDGQPRDLQAGDRIAFAPQVRHRFRNVGSEPMVALVSVNGSRLEDALVPFALHVAGRDRITVGDMLRAAVHEYELPPATVASSRVLDQLYRAIGWGLRRVGVRGFPVVGSWAER